MGREELLIGLLPPLGWFCWWATGRGLLKTKMWRRELWPAICAGAALWVGLPWWQALAGFAVMDASHRIGYWGDDPMWKTLAACAGMGVSVLVLGASWPWAGLVTCWFLVSSIASQTWPHYTWAWTESATGLWQAVALVVAWR